MAGKYGDGEAESSGLVVFAWRFSPRPLIQLPSLRKPPQVGVMMNKQDWDNAEAASPQLLGITRRTHLTTILPGFLVYAMIAEVRAAVSDHGGRTERWIDRQNEIGTALMHGEIKPGQWAMAIESLAAEIDISELMATIARSKVSSAGDPTTNDPRKRFVQFLDDQGTPRKLSYGAALFDFEPQNVITPHGHKNMVSAHLVTRGQFRIRNFDRVRDEDGAMVVRPTLDYVAKAGDISTMCAERNNIHWFVPQGGPATTFDVVISNLDQTQQSYEIKAIDVVGGQKLSDDLIRAPMMSFEGASEKYTANI